MSLEHNSRPYHSESDSGSDSDDDSDSDSASSEAESSSGAVLNIDGSASCLTIVNGRMDTLRATNFGRGGRLNSSSSEVEGV